MEGWKRVRREKEGMKLKGRKDEIADKEDGRMDGQTGEKIGVLRKGKEKMYRNEDAGKERCNNDARGYEMKVRMMANGDKKKERKNGWTDS